MASRWHPLVEVEVRRWLGADPPSASVGALLDALSVRMVVGDDVRAADSAGELEAFFRLSADLLVVLDRSSRVLHLNTAFQGWGYDVASMRGHDFLQLVVPTERESARAALESLVRTHEQIPLATRMVTAAGERRLIHWQISTDGPGERIFLVGRDVTEQERVKGERAHADRQAAMARLASGIAHEVNTPLQFITDNATFIGESLADLGPVFKAASEGATADELKAATAEADLDFLRLELPRAVAAMQEGLRRVGQLVLALKELAPAGRSIEVLEPIDVVPLLKAAVRAAVEAHPSIKVELSVEGLPLIECEPSINRVFVALIDNAVRSIRARHATGGTLTVRADRNGASAQISVHDDGVGVADSVRARLFEPFVTTREVGDGAGQSLALARLAMERHRGSIGFVSEENQGATFTLTFPLPVDESLWS